jgi:Protein of unknown function (DUF732)
MTAVRRTRTALFVGGQTYSLFLSANQGGIMRGRGVIAGVLAVCGAVALSGPAQADQYDFISQLDNMGVSYESILDMIDIGKELCHDLRSGATPAVVLGKLQTTGFAAAESAIILMSAVNNMCPDTKAGVVGWVRDNGYTGPL